MRLRLAVLLTLLASLAFWAFFQASKFSVFDAVNPFAEDPADAFGSFGFQIAVLGSLLGLARALRVNEAAAPYDKARLALRGCAVALAALFASEAPDIWLEFANPLWKTPGWGMVLGAGLAAVTLLSVVAAAAVAWAALRLPPASPLRAGPESLLDALADLWALGWAVPFWLAGSLPPVAPLVRGLEAGLRRLLAALETLAPWLSPRAHPWRFVLTSGLLAGLALAVAQLFEGGPPPSLAIAGLILLIFLTAETAATALSFLLFGGFLGLRPPIRA